MSALFGLRSAVLAVAAAAAFGGAAQSAAADWPALAIGPERARVAEPTWIGNAGDGSGRVFVAERRGRVVVFGGERAGAGTFLDIAERVNATKGGLRTLAFPFDFVDKRNFYVSYAAATGDLVIARFRLARDGAAADPASEQILLRVPLAGGARPGGGLAFGFDGKLYVGVGEGATTPGAPGAAAQSLASLAGKILRIDVGTATSPYAAPPDNPWARKPDARPEIWALGLSSPSALTVDARTGDVYIVDAPGERWSEIDVQAGTSAGGENYGWDVLDARDCRAPGSCAKTGFVMPAETLATSKDCALTAGAISAGGDNPQLEGIFFFGDRCSGRLRGLRRTPAGAWESRILLRGKLKIAAVGAAEDGRIFVADAGTGRVLEVVPAKGSGRP